MAKIQIATSTRKVHQTKKFGKTKNLDPMSGPGNSPNFLTLDQQMRSFSQKKINHGNSEDNDLGKFYAIENLLVQSYLT